MSTGIGAPRSQRWALGVEYDGQCFHGWQSQGAAPHAVGNRPAGAVLPTIQDALETALTQIADTPVQVVCAGRTDAGVHATGQVVHFDTMADRLDMAWVRGVNAHLPHACAIRWARPVPADFHARFSATGRRYRYILLNRPERPAVFAGRIGWFHRPLDATVMHHAVQSILGTHDFSSFRAAECQAKSPIRTLTEARVGRRGDWLVFDFAANAFLQHMIRNLVGALVHIGKGGAAPSLMVEWLAQKDRTLAPPTFMPDGLYLTGVDYDVSVGLPVYNRLSQAGDPLALFTL
ncbi:MAG: tRNA pseudouridine(38-40) synthase TruA [Rhodocyclaceae bacterium]|nr:tRNA pseudouridine(38-40) synthase TruA [Rhodocyclaceae bacterium]